MVSFKPSHPHMFNTGKHPPTIDFSNLCWTIATHQLQQAQQIYYFLRKLTSLAGKRLPICDGERSDLLNSVVF